MEPDSSPALGHGWRIGFLGLLHMEIFTQRLEQEYDASVILTAPSVSYKAKIRDNEGIRRRYNGKSEILIVDPAKFPESPDVQEYQEPVVSATLIVPEEYLGKILQLCMDRRGIQQSMTYVDSDRILMTVFDPIFATG